MLTPRQCQQIAKFSANTLIMNCSDQYNGFVIVPNSWVVERTFGWFNLYCRFSKNYEVVSETAESFIHIAMIRLTLKKSAQS
ncbi:transposase [Scytonema sp. NUACC21]